MLESGLDFMRTLQLVLIEYASSGVKSTLNERMGGLINVCGEVR